MGCVMALTSAAIVNLFTKSVATVSGLIFSGFLFTVFTVSEKINRRKSAHTEQQLKEHFHLLQQETVERDQLGVRPQKCAGRYPRSANLYYLRKVLQRTDTTKQDIVVMTSRLSYPSTASVATSSTSPKRSSTPTSRSCLREWSPLRKKKANTFPCSSCPARVSSTLSWSPRSAWNRRTLSVGCPTNSMPMSRLGLPATLGNDCRSRVLATLEVMFPDASSKEYPLGPHAPRLRDVDNEMLHRLWLELTGDLKFAALHHYDVIALALSELRHELDSGRREELLRQLGEELKRRQA